MGRALLVAAAAALLPGSGHLLLRRRRSGAAILAVFLLLIGVALAETVTGGRGRLLSYALNTRMLWGFAVGCVVVALLWIAVVVHTYVIARPRRTGRTRQLLGAATVMGLCAVIAAPLAFAANLAQSQRTMLNAVFPTQPIGGSGAAATAAALPARINLLMFGSDAGSDRTGTRSDSMMVASIDAATARAVIFGLPRNIEHAPFPPGSTMAAKFPRGFSDPHHPGSGDYLLNAEYAYGLTHPELAPSGPTSDRGLNVLMASLGEMLGLPIDYYVKIDMAGFAEMIDALGGVTIDVGPVPLPIGGVLPNGTHVPPSGYVPAGTQHLDGNQALWYARSRRDSDDYSRMSRQRCLVHTLLAQKTTTDLLTHFQTLATTATNNLSTNVPQSYLPALAALTGDGQTLHLDSVTFDPSLPDPHRPDGKFNPANPDFSYMRHVVAAAIAGPPAARTPPIGTATPPTSPNSPETPTSTPPSATAIPLADACTSTASGADPALPRSTQVMAHPAPVSPGATPRRSRS